MKKKYVKPITRAIKLETGGIMSESRTYRDRPDIYGNYSDAEQF